MDQLISGFPSQLKEALEIGVKAKIRPASNKIGNIVVSGLGGSGIGGNLTAQLVSDQLKVPFIVNKDYFLPGFVGPESLVIISSYSGNTEETVNAFGQAIDKGARVICVTSNGKILEEAKSRDLDYIQIPGGNPPRACLGYSFVQQLFILHQLGLTDDRIIRELDNAVKLIEGLQETIRALAAELSQKLIGKIPVIYACTPYEPVAVRFRQQLNENSKILCWHHIIPEMNHNELVGWRDNYENIAALFLVNEDDYPRNSQRINLNKGIIAKYASSVHEIRSIGDNATERNIYLIHLTDWISWYLSQIRNMDATEVNVIDYLKGELAKEPF